MSNFNDVLNYLATLSPGKKGLVFEHYCKWFLENSAYKPLIKKVWLWNDWPEKWGRDKGIDLIAETHQGEIWAIQAKAYDESYAIKKEDVDKFISESGRGSISFRLLIATTNDIGANAREVIDAQQKQIRSCLLDDLHSSDLIWPIPFDALYPVASVKKKSPRKHQQEAIANIAKGFEASSVGQVHMACGTGKTLVGLWLKERLKSNNTLVLVPSISLVSQLYEEWGAHANEDFYPIFVCSDTTVAPDDEDFVQTESIKYPVTTDPEDIVRHLSGRDKPTVVFSTYHSSPMIKRVCEIDSSMAFDLAIADEAHRCAGKVDSAFATILDPYAIRTQRKLFMTATPRILSDRVKKVAEDAECNVVSMDDLKKFGPVFHTLSFSQAIKLDLLSDYQVVISVMDNKTYREYAERGRFVAVNDEHEIDARTLAAQIMVAKAVKKYGLQKVITFHSRQKAAREFAQTLPHALGLIAEHECSALGFSDVLFGEMSQAERTRKIKKFYSLADGKFGLLANVRCLSEGVDVPALDGIAFVDPKGSEIDIVQAVGRAIRKSENKQLGTIILPVFVENEDLAIVNLEQSAFKTVWKVLNALRAHDDALVEELDTIRLELGKRTYRAPAKLKKIIIDLPIGISADFGDALRLKIIESCSSEWFSYFAQLVQFRLQNPHRWANKRSILDEERSLGMWCGTQRKVFKKNKMLLERKELLDSISFLWDCLDDAWSLMFTKLCDFRVMNPNRWPSTVSECPEEAKIARWCGTQRKTYKNKDLITQERVKMLDGIGFIWNNFGQIWQDWFEKLKLFIRENSGKWPSQKSKNFLERKLGQWCSKQRQDKKIDKLEMEKVDLLDDIKFPWDELDLRWHLMFQELIEFRKANPNKWPSGKSKDLQEAILGRWCGVQRKTFKTNKLSQERINALNKIEFLWDPSSHEWDIQFNYLKEYRSLNPNKWPTREEEFPLGNFLGLWVHTQRKALKNDELSLKRIELLNNIEFPFYMNESKWNKKFEEVQQFRRFHSNRWPSQTSIDRHERQMGVWCSSQRKKASKNVLDKEKKNMLQKIGLI